MFLNSQSPIHYKIIDSIPYQTLNAYIIGHSFINYFQFIEHLLNDEEADENFKNKFFRILNEFEIPLNNEVIKTLKYINDVLFTDSLDINF